MPKPNQTTYVCIICRGKGKIEADCDKCYNSPDQEFHEGECTPPIEIDCPWCTQKGRPPFITVA